MNKAPSSPSLRAAIFTLAGQHFPAAMNFQSAFPELVRMLALKAFEEQWPDGADTRNVRRACLLLRDVGAISSDEPTVE